MRIRVLVVLLLSSLPLNFIPPTWAACPCAQRSTSTPATPPVQPQSVLPGDAVDNYRILFAGAINTMLTYLKTLAEAINQTENLADSSKTSLLVTIERESTFLEVKRKQAAQVQDIIQISNIALEIADRWVAVGWDLRMSAAQVLIARVDKIIEGFADLATELETEIDLTSPQAETLREAKDDLEEARQLRDQSLNFVNQLVSTEEPKELARLFAKSKQIYAELIGTLQRIHLKLSSTVQPTP